MQTPLNIALAASLFLSACATESHNSIETEAVVSQKNSKKVMSDSLSVFPHPYKPIL